MNTTTEADKPAVLTWKTGYRWRILALIFFATTINYMDRTVLTVLAPTLQYKIFHWSDADYANVTIAFQAAYALGLVLSGLILDRLGTRLGYTLSISVWGFFDLLQACIRPVFSALAFPFFRFGFGLGQAGTYPAAVKSVGEWFPKKERALATGIFNAGSNMGAILAPLFVALVVSSVDGSRWQLAFIAMSSLSALCGILWWKFYRKPEACKALSADELNYIISDTNTKKVLVPEKIRWSSILPTPETWAFAIAKTTDVAWWFYTFWVGKFFYDLYGLNLKTLATPLMVIFILADIGSIGGGWLSSYFIKSGWTLNRSRKTTMLICALAALPVGFCTHLGTYFSITQKAINEISRDHPEIRTVHKLESLVGHKYNTAKLLITDTDTALGELDRKLIETSLIEHTRSDKLYWIAVCLIAFAAAGHQGWSATIFTFVTDVFPQKATASVVGFGGMCGALAGVAANYGLGQALTRGGLFGYSLMFFCAGLWYLICLGIIHRLSPRLKPAILN